VTHAALVSGFLFLLFVGSLFNDVVINSDYITSNGRVAVNRKGCRKKRLQPNIKFYLRLLKPRTSSVNIISIIVSQHPVARSCIHSVPGLCIFHATFYHN
jgi:hypothetical protein